MEEKGKTGEMEETGKTGLPRLHGFPDFPPLTWFRNDVMNNSQFSIFNSQLITNH